MKLSETYSLPLLICSVFSNSLGAATETDPTALPVAARQTPDWDAYTTLGVRTARAGFVYEDPVTGATVHKLTSAEFPVENLFAVHDYSEGGPFISAEWGDGMHTVAIRVVDAQIISTWLVDYQRGTSIASNWRRAPIFLTELAIAFSNRPGLERIVYFVFGNRLYRYNTQTMTREGETHIPVAGVEIDAAEITPNWLQSFVIEIPVSRSAGGGAEVPVVWTNVVNAIAAGNSLYEACDCGNSGARSEQEIQAGDGYMEFTAAADQQIRGAGLGNDNADNSSGDIEFAIELAGNGYAEVR